MAGLEEDRRGIVVPFRRPSRCPQRTDNRLDLGDRIELLRWSQAATARGVRRVRLEQPDPEDDPATVGDFVLIYGEDENWARWGVARNAGAYELWWPSSGRTAGRFASLRDALTAIGQDN
jgi:hypothetical protein